MRRIISVMGGSRRRLVWRGARYWEWRTRCRSFILAKFLKNPIGLFEPDLLHFHRFYASMFCLHWERLLIVSREARSVERNRSKTLIFEWGIIFAVKSSHKCELLLDVALLLFFLINLVALIVLVQYLDLRVVLMAYVRGQILNFTVVTQQLMIQPKQVRFLLKTVLPAFFAHYQL